MSVSNFSPDITMTTVENSIRSVSPLAKFNFHFRFALNSPASFLRLVSCSPFVESLASCYPFSVSCNTRAAALLFHFVLDALSASVTSSQKAIGYALWSDNEVGPYIDVYKYVNGYEAVSFARFLPQYAIFPSFLHKYAIGDWYWSSLVQCSCMHIRVRIRHICNVKF